MKKLDFYKNKNLKKLLLAFMATMSSSVAMSQITVTDLAQPVNFGRASIFDIDGDGDLDLIVGGSAGGGDRVQVYLNNGSGVFTPAPSPLDALIRPTYDWNDINQDGKPDLLITGFHGPKIAKIYNTNGTGTFTLSSITLPQEAPTAAFADFNNDGYVDILVFGNGFVSKILFSNAGNGYTETLQFTDYEFVDPSISIVDYDKDKDLDILVTATESEKRFTKLYRNDGNGSFSELNITGLFPKGNGSSTWGDYDGDGYPDLLINGDGWLNSGENDDNYWLYKNNGNGTFTPIRSFRYRQNFTTNGGQFLDWDNDGDLDIVITGWAWDKNRQATDIYLNNGGTFAEYALNNAIPGSSEGAVEVGDFDNDGDLDLAVTGFSGNNFNGAGGFNRHASFVVFNPTNNPNTAPTAPTNLNVTGNSSQANFTWSASTDNSTPQASLTYNFFLVDANNKWFYYPLSDITTGKTKTGRIGNVQYNTGWFVKNLPAGNYRWGVQAVDNSYAGSTFAEGTFTVNANGTLPVKLGDYKAAIEGRSAVVRWKSLTEINVDKYLVERSTDGKIFTVIANVPAVGNSNTANDYIARDAFPAAGKNYYRLTSVDKDARTEVFEVKVLDFKIAESLVSIYPNPVTTAEIGVQVNGRLGKVTVKVTDILGKILTTKVIDTNNDDGYFKIDLNQKPSPGLYHVTLVGENINRTIKLLIN